ncbi:MAG: potassium channel protein [Candidatus Aminicenantes bacterium]|nr:potassium channel protein [Candidatus Aminicenantes bacterium]
MWIKLWRPLLLILLMIFIGIIGFHIIEKWPFMDCLYMTVITIFTVGFKEVHALSPAGRIFTVFIILGGVGAVLFAFTQLAEIVYEGGIYKFLRRRRMEKKLGHLKDHYIICGHGRMGSEVRERLEEENVPFVVIDNNEEKLKLIKTTPKGFSIQGDASHEEILSEAGIKKAKGLAALLPTDADNLYLILTVRLLNPSLFILAKALDEEAERKLLQIGANRVVSPFKLSGLKIAQGLIRPTLVDFMDLIIRRKEIALYIEEFAVTKDSCLIDRTLKECDIRKTANVIVVAVKKPGEDIVFNPSPDIKLERGDILLVLGDEKEVSQFENTFLGAQP